MKMLMNPVKPLKLAKPENLERCDKFYQHVRTQYPSPYPT